MNALTLPRDAAAAAREWRPMDFGLKPARNVENPIVEPAWGGPRVLVLVAGRTVEARDEQGLIRALRADLDAALVTSLAATGSGSALLDGYLTALPTRDTAGVEVGLNAADTIRAGDVGRQMLMGSGTRKERRRERIEADLVRHEIVLDDDPVAFVAIDLLWIDDDPMLDVPLLERKRLLEATLAESELVRRSAHVRPPIEPWYGQWRGFGFHEMAVRSANSRYRPGERSEEWALALIPRR